jgi:hypothetical protein
MLRRTTFVFVLLAAVAAFTVSVVAGANATLILTSGERVSGILSRMGGADFTMNEGLANESRIPIGNVAVIDFVGGGQQFPAAEIAKMQAGRMLVIQRDGGTFSGRLVDIRGDNPPRLVFNTRDGEREMSANEVARVYLRRWEGMPQTQ